MADVDNQQPKPKKVKHKVIEKIDGGVKVNLMPHQLAALRSKANIAGIVGGRGCGKSIYLSVEAFNEIIQGHRVLVMAQNYKSLKINIFSEVAERFREAGLVPKVNYSEMSIKFGEGELYGFVYEALDSTRGLSQVKLLLLDELAYAPPTLLSTVTPCLRGADGSRIRFGTSPKKGSIWNKFFRDHAVEKEVFTATMFDNTELSDEDYDMQKNAIKDDLQYRQEIMGEVLDDDVEFAIIKAADYPTVKQKPHGIVRMGVDCAGSGADYNVFVVADESGIIEKVKIQQSDTFALYNEAETLIKTYEVKEVKIDTTGGFGNGLLDMIKANRPGMRVFGVNFGQKPNDETYLNSRAEMYFNLAEQIREHGFYVEDTDIQEELQYTTYNINAAGRTYLTAKKDIKALIGRSPDSADALALALYSPDGGSLTPAESLNIAMQFVSI